jgi:hypothetical protein
MEIPKDVVSSLLERNEDHIDYFNFGKIVLIFCGIGRKMYEEGNSEILSMFEHTIKESASHFSFYTKREKLASETILEDLKDLARRKFTSVYEIRAILKRIYQSIYGLSISFPDFPCILFKRND